MSYFRLVVTKLPKFKLKCFFLIYVLDSYANAKIHLIRYYLICMFKNNISENL